MLFAFINPRPAATRTPQEVESLKRLWLACPVLNLEEAGGFEQHAAELKAFREACEARWVQKPEAKLMDAAEAMGIFDNPRLVEYLQQLRMQILAIAMMAR